MKLAHDFAYDVYSWMSLFPVFGYKIDKQSHPPSHLNLNCLLLPIPLPPTLMMDANERKGNELMKACPSLCGSHGIR